MAGGHVQIATSGRKKMKKQTGLTMFLFFTGTVEKKWGR